LSTRYIISIKQRMCSVQVKTVETDIRERLGENKRVTQLR